MIYLKYFAQRWRCWCREVVLWFFFCSLDHDVATCSKVSNKLFQKWILIKLIRWNVLFQWLASIIVNQVSWVFYLIKKTKGLFSTHYFGIGYLFRITKIILCYFLKEMTSYIKASWYFRRENLGDLRGKTCVFC